MNKAARDPRVIENWLEGMAVRHPNTKATTPWHIWFASVQEVARTRRSVSQVTVEIHRARMLRAYQAGEPVYMAAAELAQYEDGARIAAMIDADGLSPIIAARRSARALK